jgi:two-component system phosphate regulon sensor histidine kinase PhoR
MMSLCTNLLLAVAAVAAGVAAILLARRLRGQQQAARRYLDALCELDCYKLLGDDTLAMLPPLDAGNPLAAICGRVRQTLERYCRRIQELEQSRTALELRGRRAAAEFQRLESVFRELHDPILVLNDYQELVLANARAEELFQFDGRPGEERALAQLVRCEKLLALLTATAGRKAPGSRGEDLEIAGPDGCARWYRATVSRLGGDEEGDAAASAPGTALAVLRDIGDQKMLQKRNAEFVSSVSHEMKAPLAGIKAYVELLVDGDAEDEQTREEFLTVINSQADRLQRLVDNLLNLARIEAGVVEVHKQPRSLNELLEEALRVIQPAAEAKQIKLARDLSPMYLAVLADRDMLLQAAINLLSNAVKYTPAGGTVTLRSRLVDDEIRFEVADTGVGLSAEDAPRVFEKFYRVKKNRDMAPGTGLGLPLAKHIVEDVHGGRLTLESTLGVGSTFTVTLPSAAQLTGTTTNPLSLREREGVRGSAGARPNTASPHPSPLPVLPERQAGEGT